MKKLTMLLLVLFALLALLGSPGRAFSAPSALSRQAAEKAVQWILSQQNPRDYSFAGFSTGFGAGATSDALLALGAAGYGQRDQARSHGPSDAAGRAMGFLRANAANYSSNPYDAARLVLATVAADLNPESATGRFGSTDVWAVINGSYDASSGHYGVDVPSHALVMLALKATGQPIPQAATRWLLDAQAASGGWAFDGNRSAGAADANTTGLALQALAAAGGDWSAARTAALDFLKNQQNADGGFAFQKGPGNESEAIPTASAIMGLVAAGEDPESGRWTLAGSNPVQFLIGLQNPSGAFRARSALPEDNAVATYQAVTALLARPLPIMQTVEPMPVPGMPRTGNGASDPAILALLGALLILAGFGALRAVRRTA